MLEHGVDMRYIQALLGHAELSTTEACTQVSILQFKAVHEKTHPARMARVGVQEGPGSGAGALAEPEA